jgi:hypothetical protein
MLTLLTLLLVNNALTQQTLHSLPTFLMRAMRLEGSNDTSMAANFSVFVSLAIQLIIPVEAELIKCKATSIK